MWILWNFFRTSFLQNIFGYLLCHYYLNHQFFEVFVLLTYLKCIHGSFGSLCNCFCFIYWVLRFHLVFLFESMKWCKKGKKRETHSPGKTMRVFIQVPHQKIYPFKLANCSSPPPPPFLENSPSLYWFFVNPP